MSFLEIYVTTLILVWAIVTLTLVYQYWKLK